MSVQINTNSKIAIIGAGIGGMALAVALAKIGAKNIRLYERRNNLEEPGAGMQLGPNACRILDQLGFSEELEAISERFPVGQLFQGVGGQKLADLPLDSYAQNVYGSHNRQLLRKDLHSMLWRGLTAQLNDTPVEMSKELVQITNPESAPVIRFIDGTEETADIVLAADGVRSATRSLLFDGATASYSGFYAWRGLVDANRLPESARINSLQVWMEEGKHLIAYPLAKGSLINLVGVSESDSWPSNSISLDTDSAAWLANYQGWNANVLQMVSALEASRKWALHQLPPLASWHRGCVGLLGDAAHPMMPSLAQGAAQALEDAVCLAELINTGSYSADELFGVYFDRRAPRAKKVQQASAWNLRFFHRRKTPFRQLQNLGMRMGGPFATKIIGRRYHWLYR